MKIKHYKLLSGLWGFMLGAFMVGDIFNYPFLFNNLSENPVSFLIPQGIYVIGSICLIACLATILQTIKKKGVFIRKNEKTLRYFGVIIVILSVASDLLFDYMTGERPANARMLAFIGGILVFVSLIFQVGIKMQEEQDLTI